MELTKKAIQAILAFGAKPNSGLPYRAHQLHVHLSDTSEWVCATDHHTLVVYGDTASKQLPTHTMSLTRLAEIVKTMNAKSRLTITSEGEYLRLSLNTGDVDVVETVPPDGDLGGMLNVMAVVPTTPPTRVVDHVAVHTRYLARLHKVSQACGNIFPKIVTTHELDPLVARWETEGYAVVIMPVRLR